MTVLVFGFLLVATYFATDHGVAVDQFSWERHVRFLRLRGFRAFPLVLDNQFLLESDRSGYPQFFIFLYALVGRLGRFWYGKYLYMLSLTGIFAAGVSSNTDFRHGLLLVLAICSSPLVLAVNRQVLPRFIGDLAVATFILNNFIGEVGLFENWLISVSLCYLVFGIHKMSLQLLIFCTAAVLPIIQGEQALVPFTAFCTAGVLYCFIFPGYSFAKYQFSEHRNILLFWKRNIDFLGASVFGNAVRALRPSRRRIRLLVLNRAALVLLPAVVSLWYLISFEDLSRLVYVQSTYLDDKAASLWMRYILAVTIILIGSIGCTTKRFSHYGSAVFYLTAPYIVGVVVIDLVVPDQTSALVTVSIINMAMVSSLVARNLVKELRNEEVYEFEAVCETLSGLPQIEHIAAFPYTWSDRIADRLCDRKILWGAHGCGGWHELTDVFPVMRLNIQDLLHRFPLDAFVIHHDEWDSFKDWGGSILSHKYLLLETDSLSHFRVYVKKI